METEGSGWKWVLQSVLETVVFITALGILGPITVKLMS